MENIQLYTKNNCPQCMMTKKFLQQNEVAYTEINLDTEPEQIDQLKNQGFQSVLVLTTADGKITIVGFRPDQLRTLAAL